MRAPNFLDLSMSPAESLGSLPRMGELEDLQTLYAVSTGERLQRAVPHQNGVLSRPLQRDPSRSGGSS